MQKISSPKWPAASYWKLKQVDVDRFSGVAVRKGTLMVRVGWLASGNSEGEEFVLKTRLLCEVSMSFPSCFVFMYYSSVGIMGDH